MTVVIDNPANSQAQPAPSPRWRTWALLAAVAALAAAGGYAMGRHSPRASVDVHHGTAQITPAQVGVNADGVSYSIPLDISWKDASGTWHQGDRPSCLPASATTVPVTFGAVKYDDLNGAAGYVVVWVDCSH